MAMTKRLNNPELSVRMARERWEGYLERARDEYDIAVNRKEDWEDSIAESELIDVHYWLDYARHESNNIRKWLRQVRENHND